MAPETKMCFDAPVPLTEGAGAIGHKFRLNMMLCILGRTVPGCPFVSKLERVKKSHLFSCSASGAARLSNRLQM